jgi:ADP-ribose pyrophosphatase
MTSNPPPDERVELIAKESLYRGYFSLDRYRLRHRLFAGGWSGEILREVLDRGHAAALLPYDPRRDEVVLIEQFRVGALGAGLEPWLIEVVAGIIEPGEDAQEVARRETEEEAGCRVEALEPIGTFLLSPGAVTETIEIYCGRVSSAGVGGIHGLDHEGEDIRAFVEPWTTVEARLQRGEVVNATAMIALQWLALNRGRLREIWR